MWCSSETCWGLCCCCCCCCCLLLGSWSSSTNLTSTIYHPLFEPHPKTLVPVSLLNYCKSVLIRVVPTGKQLGQTMQRVSLFIAPCLKTAKLLENAAFRNLLHHTVFPVQGLDVVNTFPCKMMREKGKRTVGFGQGLLEGCILYSNISNSKPVVDCCCILACTSRYDGSK